MLTISPVSENAFIIYFGHDITPQIADTIARALPIIQTAIGGGFIDMIPSYTSILVEFNSLDITMDQCIAALTPPLEHLASTHGTQTPERSLGAEEQVLEIPVYYGAEVALDQEAICTHTGLSFDDIIRLHTKQEYRVYALGFTLGFAYLGNIDDKLTMPRKTTPSFCIPKGSVAIADQQTAIYPKDSPGGWQVLGRTPLELVDMHRDNLTLLAPGNKVRFTAISKDTFLSMGGRLTAMESLDSTANRRGTISC